MKRVCALALCAVASPAFANTYVVTIEQMRFDPPTLTVHRGDEIVWVNKDLVAHTASSDTQGFDSRSIAAGASWRYRAGTPGRYTYRCIFHPTMHGTLTVQPAR
ncbi:cupredoxin family copper-binding protein [Paraburkholderia sp. Tr-20389]|uniref:cupredoxin domain-containing protein n=1 Tax=Paraburkholderia sp. Tr-20389 TaxID=2703903 RepID=UPI00197D33E0|nr:cupredoxin family copper-binding protein [Paraburkholderia sp. Tr-20389]MBN3755227.1 cupredoxin family copper-binding protein [Paraburkholderia sp. Tr-20389]